MKALILIFILGCFLSPGTNDKRKIFDVHLHGTKDITKQMQLLKNAGVYKAAISTSWDLQNRYPDEPGMNLLFGLMIPCPDGKVPYSLQPCFDNGKDLPSLHWVEDEIKKGKIDFLGEILTQYYGVSSSDSLLFPYYALAEKYKLPVGIHTGGAGPDHGSPNFKMELGNPLLLENMLNEFPQLKVWIMHGGDQYYREAITIMKKFDRVYTDISVLSNPDIVPAERFSLIMKAFMEAGLEDRLMFGTDNGDIEKVIAAVEALEFLTELQKKKVFYKNAERFFQTE